MAPRLLLPLVMSRVLSKILRSTLSLAVVFALAALVVYASGHLPTVGY